MLAKVKNATGRIGIFKHYGLIDRVCKIIRESPHIKDTEKYLGLGRQTDRSTDATK